MRLRHPGGEVVHLAYCSNVHPAEDLAGVIGQLDRFAAPVRRALDRRGIGIGLWLAADVARELDGDPDAVAALRRALATAGCEVVTLNGFPHTGFHDGVVKHRVYRPDWLEEERAAHTLRLARVLVQLLPDDVADGTISTLPLGWTDRVGRDDAEATAAAVRGMERVAEGLAALESQTSRRIALAVEPEPGCRAETAVDVAAVLGGTGGTGSTGGGSAGHQPGGHLGACLDLCHMAVQFEDPHAATAVLATAGVAVHKAQVSAGMRLAAPSGAPDRARAESHLGSPFLHQTRTRVDGVVCGVDDLDMALDGGLPDGGEWRVHVHLPLHVGGPGTTRDVTEEGLAALVGGPRPLTRHLEVETYTWTTLPPGARPGEHDDPDPDPDADLVAGIAAELEWAAAHLADLGLEEL